MRLALFDLDHTLLPIDSADGWARHLARAGRLDVDEHERRMQAFGASYHAGSFDIDGYLDYQLGLLARFDRARLERWRDQFVADRVAPQIRPEALALIARHRDEDAELALVTGTHRFVTGPIGALLGLPHVLAVEPECDAAGEFSGRYVGTHTYGAGKVRAVERFLAERGEQLETLEASTFYSDSINDLPLLERVREPVVTNGDHKLRQVAAERGWRTLELFALER
jgi:HAD superfamily hydrolase (TIGR01490 family)